MACTSSLWPSPIRKTSPYSETELMAATGTEAVTKESVWAACTLRAPASVSRSATAFLLVLEMSFPSASCVVTRITMS